MNILSNEQFTSLINSPLAIGFFSTANCGVCKSIEPKLALLQQHYSQIPFGKIDLELLPFVRGQWLVFSVPTIILFQDGKEIKRQSRFIDLAQLKTIINQYLQK